jgi:1,4-alpha-glucan branching enzyme
MESMVLKGDYAAGVWDAIAAGQHNDPFSVLGPHHDGTSRVVRCFQPQARSVTLVDRDGNVLAPMERVNPAGMFVGQLPGRKRRYLLRVNKGGQETCDIDDPYRFPSPLGELDLHLIGEGTHQRLYEKLGAHVDRVLGISGVHFAVWAPNALRVSVIGDFNDWDGRRHVMRFHPSIGVWDIFIPEIGTGTLYKYELLDATGGLLPLKSDPFAQFAEAPPGNASIVYESKYSWQDSVWMAQRHEAMALDKPQCIYELHLNSWRRRVQDDNRWLSYTELADELVEYVCDMGFTHIELLPVTEHPFDGSWGYQPIGLYAATWRFGAPDELRHLVDRCHQAGLGVIVDWVPAHFPRDPNGLGRFDGTALYEHEDPRRGEHTDWGTLVFNYGRSEVLNYLISNALFWVDEFHIDGLRVDAVASMLYLDYSRDAGEWLPNEYGGNENLEAVAFLRRLNEEVHQRGAVTIAEESTAWPGVSLPTYAGGLGFSYKWNMGWMNDTLSYMCVDPVHRQYHHDRMTFGLIYAFHENFVLPLSHDEVVHGKGSLLERMPGDEWQKFANLRAYFGFMYGHPGKKLLFMGGEFAQRQEWNHDQSLDWHLCGEPLHAGVQRLVRDLNQLYARTPALYEMDFEGPGFEWSDWNDRDNSVFSWIRYARNGDIVVVVANFTPVARTNYRIGVPKGGTYAELINTDAADYGGSGVGNLGRVESAEIAHHGRPFSLNLALPPLATIILKPLSAETAA